MQTECIRIQSWIDETVARAADSRYGLQGGPFTQDLRRAFRAIETTGRSAG